MTKRFSIGLSLIGIGLALPWLAGSVWAAGTEVCKNCVYAAGESKDALADESASTLRMVLMLGVILLLTAVAWFTYRKKSYLAIGGAVFLLIGGSFAYSLYDGGLQHDHPEGPGAACEVALAAPSGNPDEFRSVGNEFENAGLADSTVSSAVTDSLSEFKPLGDEFVSESTDVAAPVVENDANQKLLYQIVVLLALTAVVGLTVRYQLVRRLRGVVMLASVVYLGFVTGGCPCMIMSMQNVVLYALGCSIPMVAMLWFLGLIPVTYFFGKSWCGWLCHLGGLQDFLYKVSGKRILTSAKAQSVLKYIQIALLVVLLVQLAVTHTNIWVRYDPFKAAFNLVAGNTVSYVLLGLMLVASVLVYRLFCRMACPVGLVLGWVTKIPGARKMVLAPTCIDCRLCTLVCNEGALVVTPQNKVVVKHEDCILCGDCFGTCKKNSIGLKRK